MEQGKMNVMKNGSGSGAIECVENKQQLTIEEGSRSLIVVTDNTAVRSKYQRHHPEQIEKLERFFQRNSLPNERQRFDLGMEIKMDTRKVKYWFQNRRTKMKKQQEQRESAVLKRQNIRYFAENVYLREKLRNPICTICGDASECKEIPVEAFQLQVENIRLREELQRLSLLRMEILNNNPMFRKSGAMLGKLLFQRRDQV